MWREAFTSSLHILTDPVWVIEIHATVNGASFVKWGDFYYEGGPCHAFFPYKVGHLGRILGDFLRTLSFESEKVTWFPLRHGRARDSEVSA
jgi:hypothetical protein